MSTTQIKRLYQSNTEFVPITLSEAVVVNTSNIPGLSSLGITTLDKVLKTTLTVVGTNAGNISTLQQTVNTINTELAKKQDKLTAGAGINISSDGTISVTASQTLYKIVSSLPEPSAECENAIYLVYSESGVNGNVFIEYICIYETQLSKYIWEQLGQVSTDIDLSGYVTTETFNTAINTLKATTITAQDVTISDGSAKVVVNYTIPANLYDSMVNIDTSDQVVSG